MEFWWRSPYGDYYDDADDGGGGDGVGDGDDNINVNCNNNKKVIENTIFSVDLL